MESTIRVIVRQSAEDTVDGIYLGDLPLTACEAFADYFMSTRPWFKGDGWGTGGGHFTYEPVEGWVFEIVLDKPA